LRFADAIREAVLYDRRPTEAANELGIRRSTLDNAREASRPEIEADRGAPPLFGHWVVELTAMSVHGVRRDKAALSSGRKPTRQPLQPEATGVAVEVTK
jgi:hypothetical protein